MNRNWLRLQTKVHRTIYRLTNGRLGSHFGAPTLLITTIGRRSGRKRTNPLFYIVDDQAWVVVASNAGADQPPAWFLNLQANAQAQIQIRERRHEVVGRGATTAERQFLWPRLLANFPGYADYEQMRPGLLPIVILQKC